MLLELSKGTGSTAVADGTGCPPSLSAYFGFTTCSIAAMLERVTMMRCVGEMSSGVGTSSRSGTLDQKLLTSSTASGVGRLISFPEKRCNVPLTTFIVPRGES